jgi:hypothetical protein
MVLAVVHQQAVSMLSVVADQVVQDLWVQAAAKVVQMVLLRGQVQLVAVAVEVREEIHLVDLADLAS